jgi:hypothetical protein
LSGNETSICFCKASPWTEATPAGEQTLVPGVAPVSQGERLLAAIAGPLLPRRPQKPRNVGLFDEDARNQLDLFIHTGTKGPSS